MTPKLTWKELGKRDPFLSEETTNRCQAKGDLDFLNYQTRIFRQLL